MMNCERIFILMVVLILGMGGGFALSDELFLRGEVDGRMGVTLEVNDAGVLFRRGSATAELYFWDRVRDLQADDSSIQKKMEGYRLFAEDIWRARERVEREDYALAEPIFEARFKSIMGRTDPSALVVAEGLLRCRLARGAREGAVLPWLEAWRMKQAGVVTPAYGRMKAVMDVNSGLCPALAPVWIDSPALRVMVSELGLYIPIDSPVVEEVSRLYLQSAQRVVGMTPDPAIGGDEGEATGGGDGAVRTEAGRSVSVMFVKAFTDAVSPATGAEERKRAEKRLSVWISDAGWKGAWAHFARGEARINSGDEEEEQRGLVDLLYVPSEFVEQDWYLAGMALADCVRYLEVHGRVDAADSLRDDLMKEFADHPVVCLQSVARADGGD